MQVTQTATPQGSLIRVSTLVQSSIMDCHWIDSLPDSSYEFLFGVRRANFQTLQQYLTGSVFRVNNDLISDASDLALYLIKLKHGLTNRLLSSLFRCPLAELNARLNKIRDGLKNDFASKYVGFSSIDRSNVICKHSRQDLNSVFLIPKENVVLIEDGIPYLIPNDSDSSPPYISMESVIVFTTTGLIVDVVGPVIIEEPSDEQPIFTSFKQRTEWLHENDLIISNYISRQAVEPYEANSLTNVQRYVPRNDTHLSQFDLDRIRSEVKNVRNLIRVVKNRVRSFKLIEKPNWQDRLHLHTDLIITCAIINLFQRSQPITIPPHHGAAEYETSSPQHNTRRWEYKLVKPCGLTDLRQADFKKISTKHIAFPPMSREDVRDHTLEVFQVRRSYGMVKGSGGSSPSSSSVIRETSIWEPCTDNIIVKVIFEPDHFHTELDTYFWYSLYSDQTDIGWMCTCEVGQLSVWCCHHVATAIQSLGFRFHPYGKACLVGNAA